MRHRQGLDELADWDRVGDPCVAATPPKRKHLPTENFQCSWPVRVSPPLCIRRRMMLPKSAPCSPANRPDTAETQWLMSQLRSPNWLRSSSAAGWLINYRPALRAASSIHEPMLLYPSSRPNRAIDRRERFAVDLPMFKRVCPREMCHRAVADIVDVTLRECPFALVALLNLVFTQSRLGLSTKQHGRD